MANVNKNAEKMNEMFNAAQIKNETIYIENGTITIYHRVFTERGTEWLSFKAGADYDFKEVVKIMHEADNGIDLVVDGKFIGYFKWSNNFENGFAGWRLFDNDGKKIAEDQCGIKRYCEGARNLVATSMYEYIKENYIDAVEPTGEDEEMRLEYETEKMYEYAAEAHEDIEKYVEDAIELIFDIEQSLGNPEYCNLKDAIVELWERLTDIHNAFGECLHRCDELTGCDITFDDFCGTDYFSDIRIPWHMEWELEDLMYDGDPADVLENILDRILKENPEYIDTLSIAIEGTGLDLAA